MIEPKSKILLVDDTPRNLQVLGASLSKQGHKIYTATNGVQALEKIPTIQPDLVLLDIMMPEMDGLETCRKIKDDPAISDVPIIFLTAKTETDDIVEGFAVGAVDYVTKPFNSAELLARVDTQLELRANRRLIARQSVEREELLHILSHDITNCLGAPLQYLQISDELDKESDDELRGMVINNIENGLSLIQFVREMRQLIKQDYKFQLEEYNLKELVTLTINVMRNQLSQRDVKIDNGSIDDFNVTVEKTSFCNFVLKNVLSNAARFSAPGTTIKLSTSLEHGRVILSVTDQGVGMPEQTLAEVFGLDKATIRPDATGELGAGYGLAMSHRFMNAYGGEVEIQSKAREEHPDDHGTEVRLIFPKST